MVRAGVAEVVLHIAATQVQSAVHIGEFAENLARALAHEVGQDIEATAVGHTQHDVAYAMFRGALGQVVEQRNQAFGTLQREALRAEELLLHELFEQHRIRQALQRAHLFVARHLQAVLALLHAAQEPVDLAQVVDVHELHADRAAVGRAQLVKNFGQRHRARAKVAFGRETLLHVVGAEAVEGRIQLGEVGPLLAERIDLRDHVAAHAIGAHQLIEALLTTRVYACCGAGQCLGRGRLRQVERLVARERFKVGAPVGRHRLGILHPVQVEIFGEAQGRCVRRGGRVGHEWLDF